MAEIWINTGQENKLLSLSTFYMSVNKFMIKLTEIALFIVMFAANDFMSFMYSEAD